MNKMDRKVKITAIIVSIIFVIGIIGSVFVLYSQYLIPNQSKVAVVTSDGNEVARLNLVSCDDIEFTVKFEDGYNTITVENGSIYVSSSDCRDQICVEHGKLESSSLPIVCLPHKLIITFEDAD